MSASVAGSCPRSSNAFDSDLAGIGFVVACLTTALVAIFAVLAAFLIGALLDIEYKEVDFLLIDFIRYWSPWRYSRYDTREALQRSRRFKTSFAKLFGLLADQQLAISLAILIAVCSKWNEISLYSLEMAWTLATISLITHMTAIRYCPSYIRASSLLGTVRALAILIVMIGFVGLMMVLEFAQLQAQQLAAGGDGQSAESIAWRMQLACIFSQPIQTPPLRLFDIFWSIAASIYYLNILTKLKSPNGELYSFSFIYRGLVYLFCGKSVIINDYRHIYKSRMKWIPTVKPRLLQVLLEYLAEMEAAYLAIKTSVSADIPWLFFVLIYCTAQLKTVWLDASTPFWDPATGFANFGIGQIMALILLIGPLLAGVDSFIGAWPADVEPSPADVESRLIDTEAARIEKDLDVITERCWFRTFLYILSGWNMVVLIYAGIISGGPWDVDGLNLSVICLISCLFVWEVLLELWNFIIYVLVDSMRRCLGWSR